VTRWRVIAGGDPGYLVKTPMHRAQDGFHVSCRACGADFESKGWPCCPTCMKLPAEERRAMRPAAVGRLCQAPGCEQFVPRTARADVRYCSRTCSARARRARQDASSVADNSSALSDIGPPENATDNLSPPAASRSEARDHATAEMRGTGATATPSLADRDKLKTSQPPPPPGG
jgi:hypothetical protein